MGPYFQGQKPSKCGCYYPDVSRTTQVLEGSTIEVYCINHGYSQVMESEYFDYVPFLADPITDEKRDRERKRLQSRARAEGKEVVPRPIRNHTGRDVA